VTQWGQQERRLDLVREAYLMLAAALSAHVLAGLGVHGSASAGEHGRRG
jgi:hypothetical protein